MFTGIQSYLVAGLAVLILLSGVGFYVYKKTMDAEVAQLTADKAQLQSNVDKLNLAVSLNEQTIQYQKDQAAKQADANLALSKSLSDAEAQNFATVSKNKDQDLVAQSLADPDAVEKDINEEYGASNDSLTSASGAPVPVAK
jgi:hypothetical protein